MDSQQRMPSRRVIAERTRRFAPKVKTGCYSCRRRRIKCPEEKPTCRRCQIAQLDCQYPADIAGHHYAYAEGLDSLANQHGAKGLHFLAAQPSTAAALSPDGFQPSQSELELFSLFCSSTVRVASGPFNQSFWRVDVPRAAIAYPAMWHASIAMAAIHLSVSGEARNAQDADGSSSSSYLKRKPYVARNRHYIIALEHFNKSIRLLSQALQTKQAARRHYAIQEMAVMTNILYIGTASVFDDEEQISSHTKNLLRLLESFRFGDDAYDDSYNLEPAPRKGIMAYDSLLSLVLSLDGSFSQTPDMPRRGGRSWTVKVPVYDSFESVAQAYASVLFLFCASLNDANPALRSAGLPPWKARYAAGMRRFKRNIAAFRPTSDEDRLSVAVMMQQLEIVEIKLAQESATQLQDVLRIDRRYITALNRLATILSLQQPKHQHQHQHQSQQPSPPLSADAAWTPHQPGQPFLSSLSFGTMLEYVATRVCNVQVQRQVVDMMKRWPYRESGARSHESVVFYETVAEHEKTGPARTRQLLVELSLETAAEAEAEGTTQDSHHDALLEHVSQCLEACSCIADQFVCLQHKLADYHMITTSARPYIELQNLFEKNHRLPFTLYYI